ncbi:MAG: hypothetical protein FJY48_12450 [Betaproteobacteria bacterium]|nr:hypothetical protein [Betaproteobacteria bacterium]
MAILEVNHRKRSLDARQKGSVSTLIDEFQVVTDDGATTLTLKQIEQLAPGAFVNKPVLRKRHPDDARFVCTNIRLDQSDTQIYVLTATYTSMLYTANVTGDSTGTSDNPTRPYWIMSKRVYSQEWPRFVAPTTVPANFDASWPPTSAIAGTKVDVWGTPQTYKQWAADVFLTGFFDSTFLKYTEDNFDVATVLSLQTFLNKRNSQTFLNYPIGQIALVGWDEQIVEDPWRSFTLRFLATENGHLEQVTLPTQDGRPLLTSVAASPPWPAAPVVVKQLQTAFWWQPFANKADFNTMDITSFAEIITPSPTFP